MLNYKELRLGNIILNNNEFKIVDINTIKEIKNNNENFSGIAITKEILEKLDIPTQVTLDDQYWFEPDGRWLVEVVKDPTAENNYIGQCFFVHQLQNLMFALNGKEIKWRNN